MKGTWQTTDTGSGAGTAALVIGAAVLAAAIAAPIAAAAAELVRAVLIAAAVLAGLALTAGAALVAYRMRQSRAKPAMAVRGQGQVPWRAAEPLSAPRRPAIGAPREVHIHLYGASAEDIAEALRQLPHQAGR